MRILYTSAELRSAVHRLFDTDGRRVALVAFVGDGAEDFLPRPNGLQLVCCPDGHATDPDELRRLMASGVKVKFSDRLHMKLYWSRLGAVIASANLSRNGLGGGLRELGVLLEPGTVDIKRLLEAANPHRPTTKEMHRLDRERRDRPKPRPGPKPPPRRTTFGDWLKQPHRRTWKMGWWDKQGSVSSSTRALCEKLFGVKDVDDFLQCQKGDYNKHDWVLRFWTGGGSAGSPDWLFVDHVARDPKSDTPEYPYEAVQLYPLRNYGEPPFDCREKRFRAAFKAAAERYGVKRIESLVSARVPPSFLRLLRRRYALAPSRK